MSDEPTVERRARVHGALGDPTRLAVVDALVASDRSPVELQQQVALPSNLLAHHLDVLEAAGLIERSRSSGDGRRRYVHLRVDVLDTVRLRPAVEAQPALFVCTANSARSQLAAALWCSSTAAAARSAGTHPADRVHPGTIAAARRHGLDLGAAAPRSLHDITDPPALTVTVCDRAHEELEPGAGWLHWSIPDPVATGTRAAFDATVAELRRRITGLVRAA